MSVGDPMGNYMAALAALRVLLHQASRATDEALELCALGPDAKGKRRSALMTEIDDLLGVAGKTLEVAVEEWTELPLKMIWVDFDLDEDDEDDEEDEDDEDDDDDEE